MKIETIREIAAQRGIKSGRTKKDDLIRAIQRDEGNSACFATGMADTCEQEFCLWREVCA